MDDEDQQQQKCLPLDVVQIVLGYVLDTRTVAAARQACKAWRQAAHAAPCGLRLILPSNPTDMKAKLELLLQLMPSISGCVATIAAGTDRCYPSALFAQLQTFSGLRKLDVKFTDSQELAAADIQQLAALTGLTNLVMSNVSLPAATDSCHLSQLVQLQQLSLVHHSKVSALMVGDGHLQVIGKLTGLTQLELQGRMCSATDDGLMALASLARLKGLSISWVPWQSQITQSAALQLLDGLKDLASLQLGGAELLLPTTPYYPIAAAGGAPGGAAAGPAGGAGQQAGLIAVAVAAVSGSSSGTGAAMGTEAMGSSAMHGEHMRRVLGAKVEGLDTFKLQFNCCGTGVEKALLSLGDVRRKLTGLQWSYAKLSGPTSLSLLSSCTSLRTLKLRLWYQDYNLNPFELNLLALSGLSQLKTLVVDKRPPFQQQLPAQQSAVSIPMTTPVLTALGKAWPQLQKLQLGLARSDFGGSALEGLAGFSQLQSLSLHCYDQGYDDGHFMLPVDVAKLPLTLTKLDLMHAELFCSNSRSGSSSDGCGSSCRPRVTDAGSKGGSATAAASSSSSSNGGTSLRSCSSTSLTTWSRSGSCEGAGSSGSAGSSSGSSSSCANAGARPNTARPGAASAFTSMLSESFSLLSRQASAECSSAYLEQFDGSSHQQLGSSSSSQLTNGAGSSAGAMGHLLAGAGVTQELPQHGPAGRGLAAPSRQPSIDSVASGWLQDLLEDPGDPNSVDMSSASNTLQQAAPRSGRSEGGASPAPPAAAASAGRNAGAGSSTGVTAGLSKQPSLPPLPLQRTAGGSVSPAGQHAGHLRCKQVIKHGLAAAPGASTSAQQSAAAPAPPAAATLIAAGSAAASQPRPARLQNPFAAAGAAAAVHAAVGGCVAAVDTGAHAAGGAGGSDLLPLMTDPGAAAVTPAAITAGTMPSGGSQAAITSSMSQIVSSSSSKSTMSTLGLSLSVSLGMTFSMNFGGSSKSKAAAALAAGGWQANFSREVVPCLPALQQLQLKHCNLDGICLDDIITSPKELRSLQLVEVYGLAPRDIAMLPLLRSLQRLTLIAAKEDSWLGLSPLSLLAKLPELRHLDWVVSDRALPRNKATELQVLLEFPRLQVLTLHTLLGRCEQLHAVSLQLQGTCHVRLMTPAYCEHASRRSGSRIGRLLGAASCLIPGSLPSSAIH